jgi:hypothetical protein
MCLCVTPMPLFHARQNIFKTELQHHYSFLPLLWWPRYPPYKFDPFVIVYTFVPVYACHVPMVIHQFRPIEQQSPQHPHPLLPASDCPVGDVDGNDDRRYVPLPASIQPYYYYYYYYDGKHSSVSDAAMYSNVTERNDDDDDGSGGVYPLQ